MGIMITLGRMRKMVVQIVGDGLRAVPICTTQITQRPPGVRA